jgi:tetratricopeptide (TPR) repeat protein
MARTGAIMEGPAEMSQEQRANDPSRRRDRRPRVRVIAAALGMILGLAAGAHAAPTSVKVTIAVPAGAKLVPPGTGGGATARPELDVDQVLSIEELGGPVRAEQEQILTSLIANTSDAHADEKGDYYFRLGELYAKLHRHWRQKSVELAARADPTKDANAKAEAAAAAEKAKQYLQKTARTFRGLTDNEAFRSFPKLDTALFYFAHTLRSGGHALEARQVLDKLVQTFPNSKHAAEAYLLVGEHLFQSGQLVDAEHRYKIVLKFPKATVYWYAMYKLGWVHLGSQRFQEALETFYQVAQATKNDQKQEGLRNASLRDFVRVYAEIGKPDKANAAFQRVDRQLAPEMLQILADLYLEQGKSDKAISIYQELLKTAPADQNACSWQYNSALAAAYNAGKAQVIELCTGDVGRFQEWARTRGVKVSCPDCARATKLP